MCPVGWKDAILEVLWEDFVGWLKFWKKPATPALTFTNCNCMRTSPSILSHWETCPAYKGEDNEPKD